MSGRRSRQKNKVPGSNISLHIAIPTKLPNYGGPTGQGDNILNLPPQPANIESFMGEHKFDFQAYSLTSSTSEIYNCEVGKYSFQKESHLSAVNCSSSKTVDKTFSRFKNCGESVFEPIVAYENGDRFLLLGDQIGIPWEKWVENNKSTLWEDKQYGFMDETVSAIGKQLFKYVTKCHQNNAIVGNIREGLFIKPNSSMVIVPYDESVTSLGYIDNLKKDINDLRWFVETILMATDSKDCVRGREACDLFSRLFPRLDGLERLNRDGLLRCSYILCHTPLFWRSSERGLFVQMVWKLYSNNNDLFNIFIKLDAFPANMGYWWKDMLNYKGVGEIALTQVYQFGGNEEDYKTEPGIIRFIRNVFEHHQQHEPATSRKKMNEIILKLFPNVYAKIYYALASTTNSGVKLDVLMQEGSCPLNYNQ